MTHARPSITAHDQARERLIVALDVSTASEAQKIVADLQGVAGMFKVGLQLFSAAGPAFVRELVRDNHRVFLDLKFHDIPNTVASAAVEATRLGVSIFNVHAAGGREMMLRTREAVDEMVARESLSKPHVIGVTVLTSANESTMRETGVNSSTADQVRRLALLTESAGLDGVVASPLEVGLVRESVQKKEFLLVTPGVRPAQSSRDDQKRVMTPAAAIAAGADYLVLGRPITAAEDPRAAAKAIVEEMAEALTSSK